MDRDKAIFLNSADTDDFHSIMNQAVCAVAAGLNGMVCQRWDPLNESMDAVHITILDVEEYLDMQDVVDEMLEAMNNNDV